MLENYLTCAALTLSDEIARLKENAEKAHDKNPDEALELAQAVQWLEQVCLRLVEIGEAADTDSIERIKQALASEAPNEHALKAVKKPFGASMTFSRAFDGIRVQTHAQKHFDAQNNSWAAAPFGVYGDLTAKHLGEQETREVVSSAGAAANGVVQVIERMIKQADASGEIDCTVSPPDPLDKALLYPRYDQGSDNAYAYVAVRPMTPVWYLSALYQAARQASAYKLCELVSALKQDWLAKGQGQMPDPPRLFSHSIRVRQIANPANNGPMVSAIQGHVVQGVLLPPQGGQALTKWIAKRWQDESVVIEPLLKKAVYQALAEADMINRLAYQMHRVYGDEIKGSSAPENKGVRQTWFHAGWLCATEVLALLDSVDLAVIEDDEKRQAIEKQLNEIVDDWKGLRDQVWNTFISLFEKHLTSRWTSSDWKNQFYKGYEAGIFGHTDIEQQNQSSSQKRPPFSKGNKTETDRGIYLRIQLDVEAMDAASYAPTLGLIPLTSVWGALHKWIERDGGIPVTLFKVGAKHVQLLDRVSASAVATSTKLNGKALKDLFEKDAMGPEEVSNFIAGPMVNCVLAQKSHTGRKPDKIEEPLMGEVKMNAQVLIEIETGKEVDWEVLKRIEHAIEKSRFNGGFIRSFKVSGIEGNAPLHGWYALSAVDVDEGNPLVQMFLRLIRSNPSTDMTEPPFGFIQTGWQFLDVPEKHTICRNDDKFDWKAAEPVWQAVRWVGWNNSNATWWRTDELEFATEGRAIGVAPH